MFVMFCPKCGVEYRPGFKVCSDCGVDLVPTLSAKAKAPGRSENHEAPVAVWRGDDPVAFSAALAALEGAGIPAKEFSRHDQFTQVLAIQPDELAILVHPDNAALAEQVIREALQPGPEGV
jgi:zinc-ribbon domain